MIGRIEHFMTEDHSRIDAHLARSERADGTIDHAAYDEFRQSLLRHIAMEEKVLLPYARQARGGSPLPFAAALRADHGVIARLLVGPWRAEAVAALREVLVRHNALEEGQDGLYAACDDLAKDEASAIVDRLRAVPAVPLAQPSAGQPRRRE
jgi:hypothetical protein